MSAILILFYESGCRSSNPAWVGQYEWECISKKKKRENKKKKGNQLLRAPFHSSVGRRVIRRQSTRGERAEVFSP